jgi:hypothetical protein
MIEARQTDRSISSLIHHNVVLHQIAGPSEAAVASVGAWSGLKTLMYIKFDLDQYCGASMIASPSPAKVSSVAAAEAATVRFRCSHSKRRARAGS